MAQPGQGGGNPTPAPDPNTGDVLAALQAEQATLADIALLGRNCGMTLASIEKDQKALINEVRKQLAVLSDIRELINNMNAGQMQFNTQQTRWQQTDRQSTMTQRMRLNTTLSDVLGRIDKQHRQESKILHVLENRAKDLNRSAIEKLIIEETNNFEDMLSHLYDNATLYEFGDDFDAAVQSLSAANRQSAQTAMDAFRDELGKIRLSNADAQNALRGLSEQQVKELARIHAADLANNATFKDFGKLDDAEFSSLQDQLVKMQETLEKNVQDAQKQDIYDNSDVENRVNDLAKGLEILNNIDQVLKGPGMGEGNDLGALMSNGAGPVGDLVGDLLKDGAGAIGGAIGFAVGGPVGEKVGEVLGEVVAANIGKAVERLMKSMSELMETLNYHNRKTRDEAIKLSFEKIRQDYRTMSTYQIDIIESATQKIYDAWDSNLSKVNATMNYTKAQLNTLQDSVAQKLIDEGYGNVIDASKYLDELSKTLDANLNSKLAEEFATQALILEKAIPEFDATSMAKEFAAIYAQAQKQGEDGTTAMVRAMEQVAGATKAIEETTDGNNQFITKIGEYLQKSTEIVNMAGGSVDQIADLTTQMMAAEGPIGSLTPQLTGFTGELVDILTNKNDSTALALRAIMHDMNSEIGISQTEFRESFINDTQGTLETAFRALEQFIERNSSDGARFEFLDAMSDIFGVSTEKLAQIDFGYVADQLSKTNESLNKTALIEAEQLLRDGETTTLEEQLVANTANQLLATNQVRDTLDNKVMRELEKHELELERQVLALTATQSVDLAESTMGFFYKLKDIIVDLLDPLGLFKGVSSAITAIDGWTTGRADYKQFQNMSSVSSDLEDTAAANERTARLTVEGAHAIYDLTTSETWRANKADMMRDVVDAHGISNQSMYSDLADSQAAAQEANIAAQAELQTSYNTSIDIEKDALEFQEAEAKKEEEYRQARLQAQEEAQQREEESYHMNVDNHANLEKMSGDSGLNVENVQTMSSEIVHLQNIVSEQSHDIQDKQALIDESLNQFHTTYSESISTLETNIKDKTDEHINTLVSAINNSKPDVSSLRDINEGVNQVITLFSTYLEILDNAMVQSTGEGLHMAQSDRQQILGRGLLR